MVIVGMAGRLPAVLLSLTGIATPAHANGPPPILFRSVRVFDGEHTIDSTDVRVSNGVVAEVGVGLEPREGERVVDGENLTLLPGLINARVHMWSLPRSWTQDVERTGVGVVAAELGGDFPHNRIEALRHGVTTVVDAGSPTDDVVRLRNEIRRGEQIGPRMIVAGRMIVGYGEPAESPAENRSSGLRGLGGDSVREVSDAQGAREAIREMIEARVNYVSAGCGAGLTAAAAPLDAEILAALIDESHAHGLPIHVGGACPEGAFDPPAPPPDGFHGPRALTPSLARSLAAANGADPNAVRTFTPSLATLRSAPPGSREWESIATALTAAREAGFLVLAGSSYPDDGADGPGEGLLREISLLAAAGLSRREALAAATSAPARAFGREGVVGCVRAGCRGDLLVVRGNPLSDLGTLRNVEIVLAGGVPVVEAGVPAESLEEGSGRRRALVFPYLIYQDTYELGAGADLVLLDPLGTGALFNLVVLASIRGYWFTSVNIVGPDIIDSTRPEVALLAYNFPFTYFGYGNDTRFDDGRQIEHHTVLGAIGIDRRLGGNLRAGLQYRFGSMLVEDEILVDLPDLDSLVAVRGEYLSALNFYFEHDDRDTRSPIGGPTRGGRRMLAVLWGSPGLGNPTACASVHLDIRQFVPLWAGHVLALRFDGTVAIGPLPYAVMPSLGGDSNRGYYRQRFVDDAAVAIQVEYRFPIYWYFEGAAFYDVGRVFDLDRLPDSVGLHHSGGLGLRFNYNDSLVVRLDLGFSDEVIGNPIFQVAYPF